jgi:mandelamide amidase
MLEQARLADKAYESKTHRPFEGVPIALKGNIDTKGILTDGSCPAVKNHLPSKDCILTDSLINKNGMILCGKTRMHELAFGTTSSHASIEKSARNAFDINCVAGGSSGGSGGCVGIGSATIAIGTDTGGSIRIPASYNACVGYRPTVQRWPSKEYGIKMSDTRDTVGPIANCMADVLLLDTAVLG